MQNIQKILDRQQEPLNVIYVSSYTPRRCGIATYTKDLTSAINLINIHSTAEILVATNPDEALEYPWEAKYKISRNTLTDYVTAAEYINSSNADVVMLEHEFGLYGGEAGEFIVHFAEALEKPLIITFHTVPDVYDDKPAEVLRRLASKADVVTVMMDAVSKRLKDNYNIPSRKIVVIPHGVPDLPFNETDKYKRKYNVADRILLGNINLLSRDKGIEYALEAIALIKEQFPSVLYVCIGQTHPEVKLYEGESYRTSLKKKVQELGIDDNVKFVNKYLSSKDLITWLKAIDIYVTPYLRPEQVTSGALSYAVGAGKACVSTPYLYAEEVLAEERGVLVQWRNPRSLAEAVIGLLKDSDKKYEIEKRAYKYGRLMTWSHVAHRHLNLMRTVLGGPSI